MKKSALFAFIIIPMALSGYNSVQAKQSNIYDLACSSEQQTGKEKSPWHISNLYSCQKNERKCLDTAIEMTKLELDSKSDLSGIEFKWWYKNSNGSYIHDHTYRYEPNVGSVNAWKHYEQ